jgi:hypothetical protein
MLVLVWTAAYWVCFGITYGVNTVWWDNAVAVNLGFAAFCCWLYGVWIAALICLGSVIFKSNIGVLVFTGGVEMGLSFLTLIPEASKYMPAMLGDGTSLIYNAVETSAYIPSIIITAALVIVCFGLNDVNGTLEDYLGALREIFENCVARDIETVFMTPNMLNTYVAQDTAKVHYDYAGVTAGYQNDGRMDTYMSEAVKLAKAMGVKVCDCYSEWKKLSETQDTTMLLINRINHPCAEMHELFAQMLFDAIFDDGKQDGEESSDTMYSER